MRFWIDIEDASRNRSGEGPITTATRCVTRKRLNRVGEFSFEVPATDERVTMIGARRTCAIVGMVEGVETYLGGGPMDEMRTRIGADGLPMLTVSGSDLLAELSRISVGRLELTDTGDANVATLLSRANNPPLSWATIVEQGSPDFRARLVYESLFNSIFAIAEKTGAYFRLVTSSLPTRHIDWFYTIEDSGILATMHGDPVALEGNANACLITSLEIVEDSNDLKTRAFLFGSGEGDSVVTSWFSTNWPDGSILADPYIVDGNTYLFVRAGNYIINTTAEATYGRDESALAFKDIAPLTNELADLIMAGNFLVVAAMEYLHKNRMPYRAYKLAVSGLRAPLEPGQTLRVQARRFRDGEKPINIDEVLFVLEVEHTIDVNGVRISGLTVANMARWPLSSNEEIAREMGKTKILSAHPQTGPNVDTISYREHMDDGHPATLHFWLGEETTTVQSVLVRFHVDPLRSTMTNVSATGTTIGSESTHSHTIPDHNHYVNVANAATVDRATSLTIVGGNVVMNYTGVSGGDKHLNTTPGGGNVATSNAGSSHTHSFTPTITPVYGVFDQTPGNTYLATDLEWKTAADGGWTAITAGDAISGASGWYGIYITSRISSDGRPATAVNNVQFRVRAAAVVAGKSAQLTVQIERRTTIQSIAVY